MGKKKSKKFKEKNVKEAELLDLSQVEVAIKKYFSHSWLNNTVWLVCILSILAIFFVFKVFSLGLPINDPGVYVYQAKLFSEGFLPYKDFFMAHPPVHMFFLALCIEIFGPKTFVLNYGFFPLIVTLLSIFIIAYLVKKKINKFCSILTIIFILFFSPAFLVFVSASMGQELSLLFLSLCILAYTYKRVFLCALFTVFSLFTRLYSF